MEFFCDSAAYTKLHSWEHSVIGVFFRSSGQAFPCINSNRRRGKCREAVPKVLFSNTLIPIDVIARSEATRQSLATETVPLLRSPRSLRSLAMTVDFWDNLWTSAAHGIRSGREALISKMRAVGISNFYPGRSPPRNIQPGFVRGYPVSHPARYFTER